MLFTVKLFHNFMQYNLSVSLYFEKFVYQSLINATALTENLQKTYSKVFLNIVSLSYFVCNCCLLAYNFQSMVWNMDLELMSIPLVEYLKWNQRAVQGSFTDVLSHWVV